MRSGDLESHYAHELEKLIRLPLHRTPNSTNSAVSGPGAPSSSSSPHLSHMSRHKDPGWEVSTAVFFS